MRGIYQPLLITCLSAISLQSFARGSAQTEPALAARYTFHLVVSDAAAAAKPLSCPSVTVQTGQVARVTVASGTTAYQFEMEIDPQNGRMVASTKMIATKAGKQVSTSSVKQFVGEKAAIQTGALKLAIDVEQERP